MRSFKPGSRGLLMFGLSALAISAVALSACGDDDDGSDPTAGATTADGGIDYSKLSGDVRIDGSSTVFPISEAVAEEFSKVAKNVRANVAFSGTGGGFEKFCRGEIEVSDASRPIKDSEKEACAKSNISDIVELQVSIDALSVVINPSNTWATCMTPEQLQMAFKDGGARKWSDIDPSWPADDIKFFYPGADSGTFDYFREAIILGYGGSAATPPLKHRGDGTASEDDNVLLRAVEGDKNAIAYFGFAYYQEAGKELKAVEVNDKGKGCVAPSIETALGGKYTPLSRPLFIYTRESLLKEKEHVLGFIKFYLDNTNELSEEVGYVPMSDELWKQQEAKIAAFLP